MGVFGIHYYRDTNPTLVDDKVRAIEAALSDTPEEKGRIPEVLSRYFLLSLEPGLFRAPILFLEIVLFRVFIQHFVLCVEAGAPFTILDKIGHGVRHTALGWRLPGRARHSPGIRGNDSPALSNLL